ncbi:MAG: cation diffusion facilitator family transporter [Psychrobium sp.]|nr:cation diffusion facilitator family transporter [Psychrobium sp.]
MKDQYQTLVTRAAVAALIMASLMLLFKLFAWWQTGSLSMLASLVDSLLDIGASGTSLLILRYALMPPDAEHQFGHGKAESLAALAQSAFIGGSACFLFVTGIERLLHPEDVVALNLGIGVTIISIVLTAMLVTYQKYVVAKTQSQAIAADALHYQSDLLMNGAILLALLLTQWGFGIADAIFAIAISVFILVSAFKMCRLALDTLLDHKLPPCEVTQIEKIVNEEPLILNLHDLRTRRSGAIRFIQFHIVLDASLSLADAHEISHRVQSNILSELFDSDVIIHLDPI